MYKIAIRGGNTTNAKITYQVSVNTDENNEHCDEKLGFKIAGEAKRAI